MPATRMAPHSRHTGAKAAANFDRSKHPRGGSGNRGQFTRASGTGEQGKTSGVTKADRIVVLSSRVRKYRGRDTVESFIGSHPRGRAHALRLLAADHWAGRIAFEDGGTAAAIQSASAPRKGVGETYLKTSGVSGTDRISVRSRLVRKYQGHETVEDFVSSHPRGRAHAQRLLAADHKAGRIEFLGERSAPTRTRALDGTFPEQVPPPGTPERRFHDGMLEAAGVFGPRAKLTVTYRTDGRPRAFSIDTGDPADIIQRSINIPYSGDAERSVDHDLFMLGDPKRPPGQAKDFLAKSVDAYRHIGISRVNVHADINVGGYAWLRYGFAPDELSATDLAQHALAKADRMREAGILDSVTHAHLKRTLNNQDFEVASQFGGSRKVEFGGKSQPLGKHLFLGSDWTGALDLNSRHAMRQFNSYVGRA